MKRLRPPLLAIIALLSPLAGLIAAGVGWRIVGGFALLVMGLGVLFAFVPIGSFTVMVIAIVVELTVRLTGASLAFRAACRTQGQAMPWFRRWYAVPLWIAVGVGLPANTWLGNASRSFFLPAGSMEPTLRIGERFLVDRLDTPAAAELRRGDVVTFRHRDQDWIKRLVGLPGDRVQLRAGRLWINGAEVPRELVGPTVTNDLPIVVNLFRETLPGADGRPARTHQILEQSDNGPFDNTQEFRVPQDHIFVLGDNRDNSLDSRVSSTVGFIPLRDVNGRARFIFWSRGSGRIGMRLDE